MMLSISSTSIGMFFIKFNKSMKNLMIDHAFTFETIENVVLYIDKKNIRSQKATEKIGGIKITTSKYQHLTNGKPEDWTYRITKNT